MLTPNKIFLVTEFRRRKNIESVIWIIYLVSEKLYIVEK